MSDMRGNKFESLSQTLRSDDLFRDSDPLEDMSSLVKCDFNDNSLESLSLTIRSVDSKYVDSDPEEVQRLLVNIDSKSALTRNLNRDKYMPIILNCEQFLTDNNITIEKYINAGKCGVILGADMSGEKVALKFMTKAHDSIKREALIIQQFKHKNVLNMIDIPNDYKFLVMELASDDLMGYLFNKYHPKTQLLPSFQVIQRIFSQILEGVEYMHSKGFAHLDLKPMNILVFKEFQNEEQVITFKVSDFDTIKRYRSESTNKLISCHIMCGTPYYLPPEMCENLVVKDLRKVDVWMIGVIVFNLLTLYYPFDSFPIVKQINESETEFKERKLKTIEKMKNQEIIDELKHSISGDQTFDSLNEELIELLKRLLNPDQNSRELLSDIKNNSFLDLSIKRSKQFRSKRPKVNRNLKNLFGSKFQ